VKHLLYTKDRILKLSHKAYTYISFVLFYQMPKYQLAGRCVKGRSLMMDLESSLTISL